MSRPPVAPDLPPLATLLPEFAGFPSDATRFSVMLARLRQAAQALRQSQPRYFYTVRTAARFFGVPSSTVDRVYRRLEAEGLLVRIRGSGTLLQGQKARPRRAVQGVVVVPVWQYAYCRWTDWRQFFTRLAEALRERNLVCNLMFYTEHGTTNQFTAEWLLAHHPDYVLFFGTVPAVHEKILLLKDGGIQPITVGMAPHDLPVPQYQFSWTRSLARALHAWRATGITDLTVLLRNGGELAPWLKRVLDQSGLTIHRAQPGRRLGDELLRQLPSGARHGILSPEEDWLAVLASLWLDAVRDLCRQHRLLTLHRLALPRDMNFGKTQVDMVALDWVRVAKRIADDIVRRTLPPMDQPVVLHARWWPQVRAVDFAQEF